MTAREQQEYIITEEHLSELVYGYKRIDEKEEIADRVRSRPHPAPARKYDSSVYFIGESEIDAGANAISNMFKMGGLNEDQVVELNVALEQFRTASNHPIDPTEAVRKAREEVLDELQEMIKQKWEFMFGVLPYNTEISKASLFKIIESLRQQDKGE